MVSHANNSPSAGKPSAVVASWFDLGVGLSIIKPTPATREELYRAHAPAFVDGLLDCRIANGFGSTNRAVAESLPWTVGAMIGAARAALENGQIAFAPVAGFHHAGYSTAKMFCSLNGICVAACAVKAEGLADRVGIVDCDTHYGDGTQEIIDRLGLDWIKHWSVGAHYGRRADAWEFFRELPKVVESMADCGLLIYQAGVDQYEHDSMGDGWLTGAELARRDRIVLETAHRLAIPVAACLGGGYGPLQTVANLHSATLLEAARVYLP